MKKIWGKITNLDIFFGSIFSMAMVTILFCNVIGRYIIKHSIPWAEEVCLILFVLAVYFGAAGAIKTRQHLRLEIILSKLKPKARMILEIIDNIVFVAFDILIMFGLVPLVMQLYKYKTSTAVLSIPKWIIYIWLPIMFTLMAIRLIEDCVKRYREYKADPTGEIKAAKEQAEMEALMINDSEELPEAGKED